MNYKEEILLKKQHDIFMRKPLEQRFLFAMQIIEDELELIRISIRNENPFISESELKVELFKKIYNQDFSEEEVQLISSHLNCH